MKRIAILALLAAFMLSSVTVVSAAELTAQGSWRVHGQWSDNKDFTDSDGEDDFNAYQRARVYFNFIANEDLKAVLKVEIGDQEWGNVDNGAAMGTDGINIETKNAYIDFKIPGTEAKVKAGLQGVILPNAMGSAILDDDFAALTISTPITDAISLTTGWLRPYDLADGDDAGDEFDIAMLALPITCDGYSLTPFAAFAWIGEGVQTTSNNVITNLLTGDDNKDGVLTADTDAATAFWLGLNGKIDLFDPIYAAFDINYGALSAESEQYDAKGYLLDLVLGYKMDMVTPELFALYASGDDDDTSDGSEIMPAVSAWYTPTTFVWGDSKFGKSTQSASVGGVWAIGLKLKDISFVEKLSHEFIIAYIAGNSDDISTVADGKAAGTLGLDEEDSLIEVDFNTRYQMYENMAAFVELGYIAPDYEGSVKEEDAFQMNIGIKYDF